MQIGRYLIQRELAVGGMAEVFLARLPGPEHFTKPVVLKRLRPRFRDDAQVARMFLDEARMAARFDHPNLIQVYELAMLDGAYCIIMEYLRGFDLSDVLSHCIQSQQNSAG
ncbi:MAG: protein kinase, partial [Myxococcota bacterium]